MHAELLALARMFDDAARDPGRADMHEGPIITITDKLAKEISAKLRNMSDRLIDVRIVKPSILEVRTLGLTAGCPYAVQQGEVTFPPHGATQFLKSLVNMAKTTNAAEPIDTPRCAPA